MLRVSPDSSLILCGQQSLEFRGRAMTLTSSELLSLSRADPRRQSHRFAKSLWYQITKWNQSDCTSQPLSAEPSKAINRKPPESKSGFTEPYLAGPKNPVNHLDSAFQWDRDAHESVFTISLQSYLHWSSVIPWGLPGATCFIFGVITRFGQLDRNPTARFLGLAPTLPVITNKSQGRNHCVLVWIQTDVCTQEF